jgi:hypothetical protein
MQRPQMRKQLPNKIVHAVEMLLDVARKSLKMTSMTMVMMTMLRLTKLREE